MAAKYAYDKLSGRIAQADTTVNTKVSLYVGRVLIYVTTRALYTLIKAHYRLQELNPYIEYAVYDKTCIA